ncbi:hypothetical protein HmCmsJML035_03959 [Escherichia coli]|nr:hypothetical protein HmCmsJML035_03959 [Escherichia coli]GCY20611.1 hypothetical protein HmCmsJML077_04711 [Escherichia coli]
MWGGIKAVQKIVRIPITVLYHWRRHQGRLPECDKPGKYYTRRCRFTDTQFLDLPVVHHFLMLPVEEHAIVDSVFTGNLRHTGSGLQ